MDDHDPRPNAITAQAAEQFRQDPELAEAFSLLRQLSQEEPAEPAVVTHEGNTTHARGE